MEENKEELEIHQKITLIKTLSEEMLDRLLKATEQYLKDCYEKQYNHDVLFSALYNSGIQYSNFILNVVEVINPKGIFLIDKEQVDRSKEISDLENKYGN